MGLITKEVTVKWHPSNKKYYENKGYIFTKFGDEFVINVNDLSLHNKTKILCKCDICGDIHSTTIKNYLISMERGGYYCYRCYTPQRLENTRKTKLKSGISFEKWCKDNLRDDLLLRWDYEKNGCSPSDVGFASHGDHGFWFKCSDCEYHESEKKSIHDFASDGSGMTCRQCNTLYHKRPDLIKYLKNIEDAKKYSFCSTKKVPMICPFCGCEITNMIYRISTQGFSCPSCGDGFSYPNKLAFALLDQLCVKFIPEFSKPWSNHRRYDFYFIHNNQEYIIEMDGGFHYIDNPMNGQTKEDVKLIDDEKDRMAEEHNIKMIRINCKESNIQYIKNNILNSFLSELFDLSLIDWDKCNIQALNSYLKLSCEMWNQHYDLKQIIEKMNLRKATIRRYLKAGTEIGLCNYA